MAGQDVTDQAGMPELLTVTHSRVEAAGRLARDARAWRYRVTA